MKQTGDGGVAIDVDSMRPRGISSTDHEHAVITFIFAIGDELCRRGWPDPQRSHSGNGGHLVYSIAQLPDDIGLLKRVLEAFASRSRR